MPFRYYKTILCVWLVLTSHAAWSDKKKPQQVQDLHYGEVLFHFYQDDYFTALTHLMAAQSKEQLSHHAKEADLLLGGIQLSYGMSNEAEKQFLAVLDETTQQSVQDRIWYYLGKVAYQRGEFPKARTRLQRVGEIKDKQFSAEHRVLLANTNMGLGDNQAAAKTLKKTRAPEGIQEYLHINRGIALLRAGDINAGRKVLDDLGETKTDNEELRALRDRANLGLGYELLRAKQPEDARKYLNRVRLTGPFAQAALLGAGWADVENGDYQNALTPWLELITRSNYEASVQEAQLAVPFAFEKLGEQQRAVSFYNKAIEYFDTEEVTLQESVAAVKAGMLKQILRQLPNNISGGWLRRNADLEEIPAHSYLVNVLSNHRFQEQLKDFRDLSFLFRQLEIWEDNIVLFQDMVDTRRLSYQKRAPIIRKKLDEQQATALNNQWQSLNTRLHEISAAGNPLGVATSKELAQWEKIQSVENKLAQLPENRRTKKIADKTRWLKGVLAWQMQENYKEKLWKVRKQLNTLNQPLQDAWQQHQKVEHALKNADKSFAGYEERINELHARIENLKPQVTIALQKSGGALQRMALEELQQRKQRIVSYRNQARYALARNYDQLAQSTGSDHE